MHNLIERTNISNERFYVLQTETSYPYFQEHIQKFGETAETEAEAGPEEQLLKAAFDYLKGNINSSVSGIRSQSSLSETRKKARIEEELKRIRDKILGLKLISTALENDDDAYIIFETLNTRGKDLTMSDLVKSHLSRLLKPSNKGVDIAKDKWASINETFEESQVDISLSTFIHHHWLSRYEYITEKKLFKALRKKIKKENAAAFLKDLIQESKLYRQIHEPAFRKWEKEEFGIRDSLTAMELFRIRQQLPLVLSVMRRYDDDELKAKHVRDILRAVENFHFAFTAVTSQRSSGGISFMYASAARELYDKKSLAAKVKVLTGFRKKLSSKRPPYEEFEAVFADLKYSTQFTKQRNLVRYILTKIYQHNSTGLPIDPTQMTLEHLAPEHPVAGSGLTDEEVASIGNLILVDQPLNQQMKNKSFSDKVALLRDANVWVDPVVLNANDWGAAKIRERAKLLAKQAYGKVWKL